MENPTLANAPPRAPLAPHDFDVVARIVRAEAGIVLEPHKRAMVEGRLARRLRALGLDDFRSYLGRLDADAGERARLLDEITTNHTAFFREEHHFRHLARSSLPELLARAFAGGRLRIWSAGCATGEEPWSIAMTLSEGARAHGGGWLERADIALLATDIAESALSAARVGIYSKDSADAVPPPLRERYLEQSNDGWRVNERLRQLVAFRMLNLLGSWPMRGSFDIIFCRNVTIYFDEPTKIELWRRFAEALAPAGWLYIGHSERVTGSATSQLSPAGQTIYRRNGGRA